MSEVYITGVIGNSYNQDGTIKEKGVELVDVVEQVADLGEVDEVTFVIDSPGGIVTVGESIRDFIAGLPKNGITPKTHAGEMCASIATVIHTAVPLQDRSKEAGGKYMIHNPWVEMSGDAATLASVAKDMEEVEERLESHYAKATGATKQTISAFMDSEIWLSDSQCEKLGFVSQVISKASLRAVAIFQTSKIDNMSTENKSALAKAMAKIGEKFGLSTNEPNANADRTAQAVMIETDNGTVETPFADVQIGDEVMIEGAPAPDGNYIVSNGEFQAVDGMISEGDTITVTDGAISAIETAGGEEEAENLADLKAELEAEKAKVSTLEAEKAQLETENNAAAEVMEKLNLMESTAKMPTAQARFKTEPVEASFAEQMASRKEQYKKK